MRERFLKVYWANLTILLVLILLTACQADGTMAIQPTGEESVTQELPIPTIPALQSATQVPPPTLVAEKQPSPMITSSETLEIDAPYLMAFHACDSFHVECHDPRNHRVYLAGSQDGIHWDLVPGWEPFQGSVPDVIRREDTLYVYTGPWLVRYHFDTKILEGLVSIEVKYGETQESSDPVMPTDVSLFVDDAGRLVMFFLFGKMGADPAMCSPGESNCVKVIGSATEVEGSDGASFLVDAGERIHAEIGQGKPFQSLSDPDIFSDGREFYLLLSHGNYVSIWISQELQGTYRQLQVAPMGFLIAGSGGVPCGYLDPSQNVYWIYTNIHQQEGMVIRRAALKDFTRQLEEGDWETVLTGEVVGLGQGFNVESPGFAINIP